MRQVRGRQLLHVLAVIAVLAASAVTARASDLTTWADSELAPYLASQLTEHPRFKGETVVFVALDNGRPAPVTNELVLALRDRIVDAVIDRPGITIGWQTRGRDSRDGPGADCSRDNFHYYIGLEVVDLIDRRHRVTMRVLDVEDQSWVTGTARSWEGRLSGAQRRAFERSLTDEYFRGARDVPFTVAQSDMLAAYLAHELSCALLQQVAGEYAIAPQPQPDPASPLAGAIELVGNNLAGNPALQFAAGAATANAVLSGKAHRISGDLYQYWVTVTPTGDSNPLPTVSVSTYVRLESRSAAVAARKPEVTTTVAQARGRMPTTGFTASAFLSPVRIVEPQRRRSCYRAGSSDWKRRLVNADFDVRRGECFLLATRASRNATIFLLNYQVNDGLVALSAGSCGGAANSLTARAGEQLLFPTAGDPRPSASTWPGQQGVESFYAVAVSDEAASREVAAMIERLPSRCTLSPVDGLSGGALSGWLAEFGDTLQRWQGDVDWQAVRIRHSL